MLCTVLNVHTSLSRHTKSTAESGLEKSEQIMFSGKFIELKGPRPCIAVFCGDVVFLRLPASAAPSALLECQATLTDSANVLRELLCLG